MVRRLIFLLPLVGCSTVPEMEGNFGVPGVAQVSVSNQGPPPDDTGPVTNTASDQGTVIVNQGGDVFVNQHVQGPSPAAPAVFAGRARTTPAVFAKQPSVSPLAPEITEHEMADIDNQILRQQVEGDARTVVGEERWGNMSQEDKDVVVDWLLEEAE